MKLTIITDANRGLIGTIRGHHPTEQNATRNDDLVVEIVREEGQQFYHVEIPDELASLEDTNEFHERVMKYLPGSPE